MYYLCGRKNTIFTNMKHTAITLSLLASAWLLCACSHDGGQPSKTIQQVDFSQVHIDDAFWSPRLANNANATIPVCIDQIENQTGRIRNFENAARREGAHSGIFFDDSDVYKAVEGVAYSLVNNPNPELEAKMDEWIAKFAAAQWEDGYINTYYTLTTDKQRWTDMDKHEMYCAGHMLEAGIAYYKATGKRTLLDVAQRMVDHAMTQFGPDKRHWVPGHEEIELALCKLYDLTGERKYLDFAYWLLEERGHGYGSYGEGRPWNPLYYQDDVPVRDRRTISGHAVRAMYLFCGMADMAAYRDDTGYLEALDSLWLDVTRHHMYVTGGIGVAYRSEGFSEPYDLPNYDAYCETCASIGMVLWNHRMNEWKGDARYVDVLERSLYNGVLAGISASGDRFFYVNPLASHGDHHRQAWYGCACCPSNVCRFIPSIGNYVYATARDGLWVNLFIGNQATFKVGRQTVSVALQSQLPREGAFTLTFGSRMKGDLHLRMPEWTDSYAVTVNGQAAAFTAERGYAVVRGNWKKGDVVAVSMGMPVQQLEADPRVKEDVGKRAIRRGPLVYCAEGIDNAASFASITVTDHTQWQAQWDEALGGITRLNTLSADGQPVSLIPYYNWDNREPCEMKVWLDFQ